LKTINEEEKDSNSQEQSEEQRKLKEIIELGS
jgi:hypothetical protein